MLSYQHIYHAGNFADVQKHAALDALLRLLAQKPQPFSVLDTHAGRGLYDLSSAEAEKTAEFRSGILPFWGHRGQASPLKHYLDLIQSFNDDAALKTYPGSAMIAHKLMRPGDKLLLVERHPGEFEELQKHFQGKPHVTLHHDDGFRHLVDKVPLADRRGLVVIDPSYEIKTEYTDLPRQVAQAVKKWPQGQYLIWYPMLESELYLQMLTALRKTDIKDMLVSDLRLEKLPKETFGMYGTGIIVINPPFGFENTLDEITQYIAAHLPVKAVGRTFWLNNCQINPETGLI